MKKLHIISLLAVVLYSAPVVCAENQSRQNFLARSMGLPSTNPLEWEKESYWGSSFKWLVGPSKEVSLNGDTYHGFSEKKLNKARNRARIAGAVGLCAMFTSAASCFYATKENFFSSDSVVVASLCSGVFGLSLAGSMAILSKKLQNVPDNTSAAQGSKIPRNHIRWKLLKEDKDIAGFPLWIKQKPHRLDRASVALGATLAVVSPLATLGLASAFSGR